MKGSSDGSLVSVKIYLLLKNLKSRKLTNWNDEALFQENCSRFENSICGLREKLVGRMRPIANKGIVVSG